MPPRKDLTGLEHGQLVILGRSENKYVVPATGQKQTLWRVQCKKCGKIKEMPYSSFMRCITCGCGFPKRKYANCVICGKPFIIHPSDTKQCCSAKCGAALRKRNGRTTPKGSVPHQAIAAGASSEVLQKWRESFGEGGKGTAAALQLPEGQRGAQNRTARCWILIDPQGNYHKAVSLQDWARKNRGLFFPDSVPEDVAVKRIRTGFGAIAASMRGAPCRKDYPVSTYKGWRLAELPREKSGSDDEYDNEISVKRESAT